MTLTAHERMLFADGEGLTHGDLNEIGDGMISAAWEWPGYSHILPHAMMTSTYESIFPNATGLTLMSFCRGGGVGFSASTLTLNVQPGFLGVFAGTGSPLILDPKMRWAQVSDTEAIVLSAAPAGEKRYDLITVDITQTDGGSVSRDFKDATTGALSTTSVNKSRLLSPAFAVTQGTPTAGTPTTPTYPGTGYVVAVVLVNDTAIENIYDCTFPVGPGYTSLSVPTRDCVIENDWGPDSGPFTGALVSAAASGVVKLFPPQFSGDPTARLIGLEIKYTLATGSTVLLVQAMPGTSGTTTVEALTSTLTLSGAPTITKIDLRGYPSGIDARAPTPWGSGYTFKQGQLNGSGETIALKVTSGAAADKVFWLKWLWAKG